MEESKEDHSVCKICGHDPVKNKQIQQEYDVKWECLKKDSSTWKRLFENSPNVGICNASGEIMQLLIKNRVNLILHSNQFLDKERISRLYDFILGFKVKDKTKSVDIYSGHVTFDSIKPYQMTNGNDKIMLKNPINLLATPFTNIYISNIEYAIVGVLYDPRIRMICGGYQSETPLLLYNKHCVINMGLMFKQEKE